MLDVKEACCRYLTINTLLPYFPFKWPVTCIYDDNLRAFQNDPRGGATNLSTFPGLKKQPESSAVVAWKRDSSSHLKLLRLTTSQSICENMIVPLVAFENPTTIRATIKTLQRKGSKRRLEL